MVEKVQDKNVKDKAIESALALASEQPWQDVTFEQIIEHAGVDYTLAQEYFDDKSDILAAYGRLIDRDMVKNCALDAQAPHREQLFDLMMERFDIANENRAAVISVLNSFMSEPKNALETLPQLTRSMSRVLEAVGISTSGFMGCARITVVTGIYLYALKTWKDDESADLAKTMAALDKTLDRAEMLYNSLPIG